VKHVWLIKLRWRLWWKIWSHSVPYKSGREDYYSHTG